MNKILQYIFIICFITIISIPLIGTKETESLENRTLTELPTWRWSNVWVYFSDYQKYFSDRFAYRNTLINFYGKLKIETLDMKPISNKVAIGKDGYLFFCEKDYLNKIATPLSQTELQQFNYNLVIIKQWFKKHQIDYYLTIPPVKSQIYTEFLSEYLSVKTKFSRLDQVVNYLKNNNHLISYNKELKEAKKLKEIYYKTDTHWNENGAFIAYKKIINSINNYKIEPLKLNQFTIAKENNQTGDLKDMLGFNSSFSRNYYNYKVTNATNLPELTFESTPNNISNNLEIWEKPQKENDLKLFVVRDSFTEHLKTFLSLHFDRSVYVWQPNLPIQKIAEEKPDIIIHEILSRFMHLYLELPPEITNDTTFLKQYDINNF